MNPTDYGNGMLWMGQFAPDRMILEDNSMLSVGMSVMDDITPQTHSMEMNPGIVSEYTAATAPGPIARLPPDIFPITSQHQFTQQQQQQHQQQQTVLDAYGDVGEDDDSMQQYEEEQDMDQGQYTQFDSDPDNSNNSYTIQKSMSTQTSKKIKPVKRPGLVLKTPIAYQPCLDPSVIPIQRDGMAVCERCGAIGVKHSFYTKERRFCSMACARNDIDQTYNKQQFVNSLNADYNNGNMEAGDVDFENQTNNSQVQSYRFKMTPQPNANQDGVLYKDILPQEELPQIPKGHRLPSPCPQDDKILTIRRKPSVFFNSHDWTPQLQANPNFNAADVTCFPHAPGYDMWSNIGIGMKVEVENTDCDNKGMQGLTPYSFWVATVYRICGYKALLRYEGYDDDDSHDFWINLCSSEVHPVGWCATRGKPLIPPRSIETKYSDWKDLLVRHLSGARTLPSTFYSKISDSFVSRFRTGLILEVVDKNRISQVKLATVQQIVGKRLFVTYFDAPPDDNGFWCHEDSSLIHPVGWATLVGHNLSAPDEYVERMIAGREQVIDSYEEDAAFELFKMNFAFEEYYLGGKVSSFREGMKLEAIDPLNLSSICVATVMAVLKYGYMMIRIDSYDPDASGADWFCYHEKSHCIFPPGFCDENGITLTLPRGYENGNFSWKSYLQRTNSVAAGKHLFNVELPPNNFTVGMKLECADLMDPRLVCVATIAKVVGRLLKVHFDGWEDEYDQWLDCESPDMYPVGWCVLVGHKLEGPRILPKVPAPPKISPRTRKRRKKKVKMNNGGLNLGVKDELEEFSDDYEDEYSYSLSGQSTPVPPTPEPPTKTPTPTITAEMFLKSPSPHREKKIDKNIPRLSESPDLTDVDCVNWTADDVAEFLRVNDCPAHANAFINKDITGEKMLKLTNNDIITMIGLKVGPALKIFDLIQQLRSKMRPHQSRQIKAKFL
ncbi:polycomb protein Sfmbt isoform X3 [Bradysia coprophila]|uniref:polycomb protein Sfmbt isoform X3 n=1 Tax=Bradysia coprophila TaxID=38358 RepID=UPI00187DD7B2|nr:polycomb protein Sfmbt isoform X3 [Bradysia coprophila]